MLKPAIFSAAAVGVQRLLELRLSRHNERRLRARGAIERGQGHYPAMVALHALWLLSTAVEGSRNFNARPGRMALTAFVLVQPLRYWAITSLGERWSTRVLVVPGEQLVRKGPYRYVKHPNYIVVAAEILTLPLIFRAWITALVFSILNAALLAVRIRKEEQTLRELADSSNDG